MGKEIIGILNSLVGKNSEKAKKIFSSKRWKKCNTWIVILVLLLSMTVLSIGLASCSLSDNGSSSAEVQTEQQSMANKAISPRGDMNVNFKNQETGEGDWDSGEIKRKIIQTAVMSIRVANVSETLEKITLLSKGNGGYIVNSSLIRNEERYRGNITLKVPTEKLAEIMGKISSLGELLDKSLATRDVSEEYYDSQARLTIMQKKEERLLSFMERAKDITEVILVENELGKVRTDIEVLQGRLKYLDNASSFSEINVNIQQALSGQVVAPKGTFDKAIQGFINSINYLVDLASNLLVGICFIFPWLTILTALYLFYRFFRKKLKKAEGE